MGKKIYQIPSFERANMQFESLKAGNQLKRHIVSVIIKYQALDSTIDFIIILQLIVINDGKKL